MEMFGIYFLVPALFIASSIYALIIKKITAKWNSLIAPLFWISGIILILMVLEFIGILTIGADRLREAIGEPIHFFLFFLFWPSLVNIMQMQKKIVFLSKWYIIGITCAFILWLLLVLHPFCGDQMDCDAVGKMPLRFEKEAVYDSNIKELIAFLEGIIAK